jgi:hypothetical protein
MPAPPTGLIERGEAEAELPLATTKLQLSWSETGHTSIHVFGDRSVTDSGEPYRGAVTITWIKDGKKTHTTTTTFVPENPEDLRASIDVGRDKDDHYDVVLEFEAQEGFDTSTITIR